ncbi:MAG: malate dehydrogenase [Archaeoglobaceae archaeon]|nr:malate dehydrogenase [Archaeoglobaceae archaeon]MCX8151548.1 malate dehydrogenase [Archaeoglobaceae archaeon]MDW8013216.1 malate dehydrogenase [Archaeoglobaceae archaeon]
MKLGFLGAGRVGSVTAFTCLISLNVDEIALVDIAKDLAEGEAIDLSHAAAALDKYPKIYGGDDYSKLEGSDVIVVAAGFARRPGMTRLDLAEKNAGIIKDVAKKISSFESKILVVTNPMDLMTYVMWKESGKRRNEVFGMGSLLDSSRLKDRLKAHGVKNIRRSWIIGEHGDTMFAVRSLADFDGRVDWESIEGDVRKVAAEVIAKKGATVFGPAVCICRMIKAVVENTGEIIPTSCVLDGEYGIKNVALGVPAKLSKKGAEIVEVELSKDEMEKLKRSANVLKEWLQKIGY